MTVRSWIRKLLARTPCRAPKRSRKAPVVTARASRRWKTGSRLVPTTFHVTSLFDDGSAGTLRWAITQANANRGPDTLDFQVAGTIALSSGEMGIHDAVTITGPGAANLPSTPTGASRISRLMLFPDTVQRIKAVSTCGPGAHSWGNPLGVVLTQSRGSLGTNEGSGKGPLSLGR